MCSAPVGEGAKRKRCGGISSDTAGRMFPQRPLAHPEEERQAEAKPDQERGRDAKPPPLYRCSPCLGGGPDEEGESGDAKVEDELGRGHTGEPEREVAAK